MRSFLTLLLLIFCLISPNAKALISDIGEREILIDAGFSGKDLFLFGARNQTGEIVVVVRGPKENYIVRKKEKTTGVWLNRKQMKFYDITGFYSVFSTMDLNKASNQVIIRNLDIGIDNLISKYEGKAYLDNIEDFKNAIIEDKTVDKLYHRKLGDVKFIGDTLFKTVISFPKKISSGLYNIEIYLIDSDNLVAMQSIPLEARKTGFAALISRFAHEHSIFYGFFCVAAAIVAGWFASIIFWKV
jgi:uncharacterized protein (TIGR02186 family)